MSQRRLDLADAWALEIQREREAIQRAEAALALLAGPVWPTTTQIRAAAESIRDVIEIAKEYTNFSSDLVV